MKTIKENGIFIPSVWEDLVAKRMVSRPIFLKPTNELIEEYLALNNYQWMKKRLLKDTLFSEFIRDYLEKKLSK